MSFNNFQCLMEPKRNLKFALNGFRAALRLSIAGFCLKARLFIGIPRVNLY
ncbi:hypothetical protein SAMN05444123_106170 [Rhodopseudomonas pseudopalustris]|uniref:Uncharacterized protein n=1 Tax=Rhodopseudomonas pseudopalustris TaxID=1513892 RepID=A0A1H8TX96_9BRAD|nr:hypothetical protein SAMN05444123_106170 [Rhodopseudomonas pseudopalustris]